MTARPPAPSSLRLHLWAPEIAEGHGGIFVYSNFTLRALDQSPLVHSITVASKNDRRRLPPGHRITHPVATGRWPGPLRTAAFAAEACAGISFARPHLVLSTLLNFGPALATARRVTRTPFWLVAHGIEAWNLQHPARKAALHAADRILCISPYTRSRLIAEQRLDPERVVIQSDTFDPSRFRIAPKPPALLERHNLNPDDRVILTVARLAATERYKGCDHVIEALPAVAEACPDVRYIIVGKGDDAPRLQDLAARKGVAGRVIMTGYVPDADLPEYYNLCDLYAMPSTGEGFGIVFLEALASGKPVLGGSTDASADTLLDGELGALVNPANISALTQELITLLRGKHPKQPLWTPEALRERAIKNFAFDRFQASLDRHLADFISRRSPATR